MTLASAACPAIAAMLLAPVLHGQSPGGTDVILAAGSRRHVVARIVDGKLAPAAPCVPADAPVDPAAPLAVVGPVGVSLPRAVAVGSAEWNRVSPLVLTLAERREREQRLAQGTTSKAPRFLDWLFASDDAGARRQHREGGDQPTYYFEVSRRVPSIAAPLDVDVDTDPPGTLRIAVSGFVRLEPAGVTPLGTKGELRWEQDELPRGPSRPDLRPLGILALPGDPVWVMESRMPASSVVGFYAVGPAGTTLRATTRLGGC